MGAGTKIVWDVIVPMLRKETIANIWRRCCFIWKKTTANVERKARKNYLVLAKARKCSPKMIRAAIRKQLSYVKRGIKYLDGFMSDGYAPVAKEIKQLLTIYKVYEQQEYMYKNKVHSVVDRIISIHQPWQRPIVRGKAKAPVEFGAKFDLSIDEDGYGRIETISFDAYNESTVLQDAVEHYKARIGR